jgi:hypothetical protein
VSRGTAPKPNSQVAGSSCTGFRLCSLFRTLLEETFPLSYETGKIETSARPEWCRELVLRQWMRLLLATLANYREAVIYATRRYQCAKARQPRRRNIILSLDAQSTSLQKPLSNIACIQFPGIDQAKSTRTRRIMTFTQYIDKREGWYHDSAQTSQPFSFQCPRPSKSKNAFPTQCRSLTWTASRLRPPPTQSATQLRSLRRRVLNLLHHARGPIPANLREAA